MFHKETEYALRAMVFIRVKNLEDEWPGSVAISEEIQAPVHFIAKILQRLVRQGLLSSQKGKRGGFYFTEEQAQESVMKVVEATEGSKIFTACGMGISQCSADNPCPLHDRFASIRSNLYDTLSEESIANLAQKYQENPNYQLF